MTDPLQPTKLGGTLDQLLVYSGEEGAPSQQIESVDVSFSGFAGEAHSGLTRESCSRVKKQYPKGTEIRNTRQITILSQEELGEIAAKLEIPELDPAWLWANCVMSGLPDLSSVPPSSRMIFTSGVSLVIDMENAPCRYPGDMITQHHPEAGKYFANRAAGLRGVTAWVEREGKLQVGDTFVLHCPLARPYKHV